jgi:hypothetical protein
MENKKKLKPPTSYQSLLFFCDSQRTAHTTFSDWWCFAASKNSYRLSPSKVGWKRKFPNCSLNQRPDAPGKFNLN